MPLVVVADGLISGTISKGEQSRAALHEGTAPTHTHSPGSNFQGQGQPFFFPSLRPEKIQPKRNTDGRFRDKIRFHARLGGGRSVGRHGQYRPGQRLAEVHLLSGSLLLRVLVGSVWAEEGQIRNLLS